MPTRQHPAKPALDNVSEPLSGQGNQVIVVLVKLEILRHAPQVHDLPPYKRMVQKIGVSGKAISKDQRITFGCDKRP
jgi:hypothetical protein